MFYKKIKKFTIGIILSAFIFSSMAGFLLSAQPAQAIPVEILGDVPRQAGGIFDMIKNGWKIAIMNAFQQAVAYGMRKVAYDSAVYIASGGKGQKPFWHTDNNKSYLQNVADEAAGTAIEQLGSGFGVNLCMIPDVKVDLAFRLGLHYNFATADGNKPPPPSCSFTKFLENWNGDAWASKYGDGAGGVDSSKLFNSSFSADNTDLGLALKSTEQIDRLVAKQTNGASADRIEGQGFKTLANLIDGKTKTPSQAIKQSAEANSPSANQKKSEEQMMAALGAGAYEILPSTLSLFLNTLAGQMVKNFQDKGMLPFGACVGGYGGAACKSGGTAANYDASPDVNGRAVAEAVFSDFLIVKLNPSNNYDIIKELNSGCDTNNRGLYNCRIDQGLVRAIQEDKNGKPMTIAEALSNGSLKGDRKIISPKDQIHDSNCEVDNFYCYSNIRVLRQLGIMPLGLEIAALHSDPDSPWTLSDVVRGFYDCNKNQFGDIIYDPVNHPFCHLVDPNWVIKLNQTKCSVFASSAVPQSSGIPDRIQECEDLKICTAESKDPSHTCLNFGNCLREKNIWRFEADSCDAQFATCRTFADSSGKNVSYLYRTLDTGECDQKTAGCQAYSLEQNDSGNWNPVNKIDYGSYSTGIYLNKNVATNCSANSAGCSAFRALNDDGHGTVFNIKKAPDYLHCYDVGADQSNGIQWPQNFADIAKLKPREECKNYASVCIADEIGCSQYTLADVPAGESAPIIPGKFTPASSTIDAVSGTTITDWNDQCDAKCAGYDAYREMPTKYSAGTALTYLVPPSAYNNSGTTCNANQEGCNSFTNLSTTENGGEKVEYFTDLRACIKPDITKQKNFYTYEGSIAGGYQLQSFVLQEDKTGDSDPNAKAGGPAYVFATDQEKIDAKEICNATKYKSSLQDVLISDCREFNDDKGSVYYRLLSHTVVVSADCTPYRLNSSELAGKDTCFGNGELKDGFCFYQGLPGGIETSAGSSQSCTADVVSCRAYKGSSANKIQTVLTDTFENQAELLPENGWTTDTSTSPNNTISWSTESTHIGGHSLSFVGVGALQKTVPLKGGNLDALSNLGYSVSFWAKGSGVNVAVLMQDGRGNNTSTSSISVNNTWQYFKFNFELNSAGESGEGDLIFQNAVNGNLFLDNLRVTKVVDYLYLVKDSLRVDSICDDNQQDNLPGHALGCTAYTGPQSTNPDNLKSATGQDLYFLTNFSFLCRDGAIGCTAFKDTFNKSNSTVSDTGPRAYNVRLTGATASKASIVLGNDSYSCNIEQGKTSCYVNILGHDKKEIETQSLGNAKADFVNSTYFVPADTSNSDPIYLVAKNDQVDFTCSSADLGCTFAGLQKSTPSGNKFETTTIKLDPNQFDTWSDSSGAIKDGILCHQEALGCNAYASSKGDAYFKDPQITGAKICTYNNSVQIKDVNTSGWFWSGVGVCASTSTPAVLTANTCTADSDCAGGNVCINKDIQPCYPNYLQNGNAYGLWSYGDKGKYDNFVGTCPTQQNDCTQFVDHNELDSFGNPIAYFKINNDKIQTNNCSGQVSQKAGCVLFDQVDKPNKIWNTAATYAKSDAYYVSSTSGQIDINQVTKVPPQSVPGNNDANIIIQVTHDRECAEWLQCKQSHPVWDDQLNSWKQVCEKVGRCDRLPANAQGNNSTNCAEFIDGQHSDSEQLLTEDLYINRDTTWNGHDYDGLSILGMYPVEELKQFDINTDTSTISDWRLVKPIVCSGGVVNNCPDNPLSDFACIKSGESCGPGKKGLCLNGNCLRDPYGDNSVTDIVEKSPRYTCRAYPESSAPFPNFSQTSKQDFSGVNKCNELTLDQAPNQLNCECSYSKVSFGNGAMTKYFGYNSTTTDSNNSVCIGGKNNGKLCEGKDLASTSATSTPTSCQGGTCQILDKVSEFLGWQGQCLEKDFSRTINGLKDEYPCLSWLPVDKLDGAIDINDQNSLAGFTPYPNHQYCLDGEYYQKLKPFGTCEWHPKIKYVGIAFVPKCDSKKCEELGKKYCENYPGFTLKTDDQYFFEKVDLPVIGYYCGGIAIGGKKDGNGDCSGLFNSCKWDCVQKETVVKAGGWMALDKPTSANDTAIGCRIVAKIDKTAVAQTDNIWKDKKDFKLTVFDSNYLNNLNYNFNSPIDTFARLTSYTDTANQDLIRLMYCNTSPTISMPFSDGSCKDTKNEITTINADSGKIIKNLTYGGWTIGSTQNCTDSQSCNGGASGAACVGAVSAPAKCQRFCKIDNDCKFSYENDNQDQVSVDLGNCILPSSGTGLGTCSNFADNACFDHSYGDKTTNNCQQCVGPNSNGEYIPYKCNCQTEQIISNECQNVKIVSYPNNTSNENGVCKVAKTAGKCNDKSLDPYKGTDCLTNHECYSKVCIESFVGGGPVFVCADKVTPPKPPDEISAKINNAFHEFHQLFAKVDISSLWLFSTKNQAYELLKDDTTVKTNLITNDITNFGNAPSVHPVGACNSSGQCLELPQAGITINDQSSGNIFITALPHPAILHFFASADKNQMPIRKIKIDWGDGTGAHPYGGNQGSSFSNQRGAVQANSCINGNCIYIGTNGQSVSSTIHCSKTFDCKNQLLDICQEKSIAPDFATISKITCDSHYFSFNYTYDCIQSDTKHWNQDCSTIDPKWEGGCCIFHPKVQVLDNWGWCNGTCGDEKSAGGVGCYQGEKLATEDNGWKNECDILGSQSIQFTPLNIQNILVSPNKTESPIK